jgi:hypothetical protein
MLCHLPDDYVWKQTIDLNRFYYHNLIKLKNSALMDSAHHYAKSKRLWTQEDEFYISKKNLVHAVRFLNLSLQIMEHGRVTDFQVGNDHWQRLMRNEDELPDERKSRKENWISYELEYKPLISDLMHRVSDFSHVPEAKPLEEVSKTKQSRKVKHSKKGPDTRSTREKYIPETLQAIPYIQTNGLASLWRDFSMHIVHYDDMIVVSKDDDTPSFTTPCAVPRQSSAMILDQSAQRIIAITHAPLLDRYDDANVENDIIGASLEIDWIPGSRINISEKADGVNVILFWHHDEWRFIVPVLVSKSEFKRQQTVHIAQFKRITAPRECNPLEEIDEKKEIMIEMEGIVRNVWNRVGYAFPTEHQCCYSFELCMSAKEIENATKNALIAEVLASKVVQHEDVKLLLHGVYQISEDSLRMTQHDIWETAKAMNWEAVALISRHEYNDTETLKDIEEQVRARARNVDPLICEGFVLTDETRKHRIKYCSPQFEPLTQLRFAHMYDANSNERNVWQIVRVNDIQTFRSVEPWSEQISCLELYDQISNEFLESCRILQQVYDMLWRESQGNEREFAIKCKEHVLNQGLFDLYKNKCSAREYFSFCINKRFLKIMKDIKKLEIK